MAEPRPAILGPLKPLLISTDQRTDDRLAPGGLCWMALSSPALLALPSHQPLGSCNLKSNKVIPLA